MDITEEEKAKIREKVEKLKNSKFKQQTLPAWRPIPSFKSTMITFLVFGIIFLALGIVLFLMSNQIVEFTGRYDNAADCKIGSTCTISFDVTTAVAGPVYFYYQLDNFYQNHRRYVKSRDYNQLKGQYLTPDKISTSCDPIVYMNQTGRRTFVDKTVTFNGSAPAYPCGLVAKSFFNDTYALSFVSGGVTN
jgi:LEM3 (ligand-effect modulator 3) family / CDC50 family